MKYATVCSGIEAPTVAWKGLGWQAQWFSEIAKFPSAVLSHHYPNIPNLGDMTKLLDHELSPIDLLCGGTPCQSFSVAGLRKGLDDPRGNLALVFLGLVEVLRPRWVVWENVPGVLSSWSGNEPPSDLPEGQQWEATETSDFGCFLAGLSEIGYGWSYRVFDAQYFGLAQRRKRVFVVGHSGGWTYPTAVLLERHGLRWNSPPSRKKGKDFTYDIAPCIRAKGPGVSRVGRGDDPLVACPDVSHCLTAHHSARLDYSESFIAEVAPTLCSHGKSAGSVTQQMAQSGGLVFNGTQLTSTVNRSNPKPGDPAPTLTAQSVAPLFIGSGVRRLTPIECERLQGFPDDYTQIAYRKKPAADCPDGPRYEAIGNSMPVDVLRWIGKRIAFVDSLHA